MKIYLRFKDDIFVIVDGTNDEISNALEIIATGYPQELQLNSEANIVHGKFLNLKLYNMNDKKLFTTILRKRNYKYDIIPPKSNTNPIYKTCAPNTYFQMVDTHCSNEAEKKRQRQTVKQILKLKGHGSFNRRTCRSNQEQEQLNMMPLLKHTFTCIK